MPEKAKFIIELDLDTLSEMADIFKRLDIEFDAVENMVCLPQDGIRNAILTGADMDEVIANANDHLADTRDRRRLRKEFGRMPPETRRDLMELLTPRAPRHDGKVLNEIAPQAWETFQQQHPEAMRKA